MNYLDASIGKFFRLKNSSLVRQPAFWAFFFLQHGLDLAIFTKRHFFYTDEKKCKLPLIRHRTGSLQNN